MWAIDSRKLENSSINTPRVDLGGRYTISRRSGFGRYDRRTSRSSKDLNEERSSERWKADADTLLLNIRTKKPPLEPRGHWRDEFPSGHVVLMTGSPWSGVSQVSLSATKSGLVCSMCSRIISALETSEFTFMRWRLMTFDLVLEPSSRSGKTGDTMKMIAKLSWWSHRRPSRRFPFELGFWFFSILGFFVLCGFLY